MKKGYVKPDLKSLHYDTELGKISSLKGKTIAITGTTTGTGFIAAQTVVEKVQKPYFLTAIRSITKRVRSFKNKPTSGGYD